MERGGMQFITTLFGDSAGTILNAIFALGIVLLLIVLGVWALKLVSNGTGRLANTRRRLTVVDKAQIDGKRQVVIVRRDNVEHVIMTGGPQDMVIESGIAAPEPPRRQPQRPAQPVPQPPARETAASAAPPKPEHNVSREAVDRLRDLARPAPLKPRPPLRHTALLRPVDTPDRVIPIATGGRGDKSAGAAGDSATPGPDGNGPTPLGSGNRFFRSIRGEQR